MQVAYSLFSLSQLHCHSSAHCHRQKHHRIHQRTKHSWCFLWSWRWLAVEPFTKLPHTWAVPTFVNNPPSMTPSGISCWPIYTCFRTHLGQMMTRKQSQSGSSRWKGNKGIRNGSLILNSIRNIYIELARANNWRVLITIPEQLKHNIDECRDEHISRERRGKDGQKSNSMGVKTFKHSCYFAFSSNYQDATAFPVHRCMIFFHPIRLMNWKVT